MVQEGSNEGLNKALWKGRKKRYKCRGVVPVGTEFPELCNCFTWKAQTKKKKIHLLSKINLRFYTKISLFQTYLDYRFRDTYLLFLDFPSQTSLERTKSN